MDPLATNGRMLGAYRQPFCKKCCGDHDKASLTIKKRAERRHVHQEFRSIDINQEA